MNLLTKSVPTGTSEPVLGAAPEQAMDPALKRAIRGVLSHLSPMVARDRRRYARQPMPMLMELTPVDAETEEPVGSPTVVVGKSLSMVGIGFFHEHALPHRRAVVRIGNLPEDDVAFLVDLSWCRYTRYGWYESGGRFLKVVESVDGCHGGRAQNTAG